MTKEYPLRRIASKNCGVTEQVCECGHNNHQHTVSNQVLTSNPPQYIYLECQTCMCPEYKFEKEYKIHLPM